MRTRRSKWIMVLSCLFAISITTEAQTDKFTAKTIESMPDFIELLSIPCDAHFHEDIEKNVLWAENTFTDRGYRTRRLATETVPLLLAEKSFGNSAQDKTLLVYLQMDGQPVDTNF